MGVDRGRNCVRERARKRELVFFFTQNILTQPLHLWGTFAPSHLKLGLIYTLLLCRLTLHDPISIARPECFAPLCWLEQSRHYTSGWDSQPLLWWSKHKNQQANKNKFLSRPVFSRASCLKKKTVSPLSWQQCSFLSLCGCKVAVSHFGHFFHLFIFFWLIVMILPSLHVCLFLHGWPGEHSAL